ncbi:hypothetical protein CBR_g36804 [Chara braunii]|uniref:Uncharacterized protein n=1 Tax=Chara braunii TaxID=69332 RepID=A0A388LLI7_CHABU|nr:hypothetical protein CBR_g36804 [Chara braunii]|eukprot:GBG83188.1 hypothetical protein CBR_g36804 [Chara braunii]
MADVRAAERRWRGDGGRRTGGQRWRGDGGRRRTGGGGGGEEMAAGGGREVAEAERRWREEVTGRGRREVAEAEERRWRGEADGGGRRWTGVGPRWAQVGGGRAEVGGGRTEVGGGRTEVRRGRGQRRWRRPVLSEKTRLDFEQGQMIQLMDWRWMESGSFPEDSVNAIRCCVLPSLCEGLVTGCSLRPPEDVSPQQLESLWLDRYGLELEEGYFYVYVSIFHDHYMSNPTVYPSCCVLTQPGLMPLPTSVRSKRVPGVLQRIAAHIAECQLFGAITLRIAATPGTAEGSCCEEPSVMWHKASWTSASTLINDSSSTVSTGSDMADDSCSVSMVPNLVRGALPNMRRSKPPCLFHTRENTKPCVEQSEYPDIDPSAADVTSTESAKVNPAEHDTAGSEAPPPARLLIAPKFGIRKNAQGVVKALASTKKTDIPEGE